MKHWSGVDLGGSLLHRGNNQARHCWREKNIKIYDSNQSGLALLYIQHLFFLSCSVKACEWLVKGGLDCIREFRQGGQIVSWMATSEAVPP